MSIKHRILATVAAGTMVAGFGLAAVPAGAGELPIGNPPPCPTHGWCGGHGGPDDLANPTADPDDPVDPGTPGATDVPIPANATFTG